MKKLILILIFKLILLSGCQTYQKSIIDGNYSYSPTVGFSGYSIKFPEEYSHFQPIEDLKNKTPSYGQSAWRMATDYDNNRGLINQEIIVYEKKGYGISLTICLMALNKHFSNMGDNSQEKFIKRRADNFTFPSGNELYRKHEKIGGHWVAMVAREIIQGKNTFVNVVYVAPSSLKEVFVLNGIAYHKNLNKLEKDMQSMIMSLDLDPNKGSKSK